MCDVLEVSRSGYHAWRTRPASRRSQQRELLLAEIEDIHLKRRKVYGSPRVHAELTARGWRCNVKTVAKLMQTHGIQAQSAKKFKVTTDSRHGWPVAQNVLHRNFEAEGADQVWLSDITYVWTTREGWLYLAAVEDLYSRKVVGWSMSNRMTSRLVRDALEMAIGRRFPGEGLLHHSDRGSQYASEDYQRLLGKHGIRCSMSRKGDCYDNAPMESFFATLKKELIHREQYETRAAARQSIFEYIELFYNRVRRHSALGYKSPAEFEGVA
jgi:transposase InsO family protein